MNARWSFTDGWPRLARFGYLLFAVASATAFTGVFYAATAVASYATMLAAAAVWDKPLGSPVFGVAFPIFMLIVGCSAALVVYTPLTACVASWAKRRFKVWLLAPLVVVLGAFGTGAVIASGLDLPDEDGRLALQALVAVLLPYFVAGGYVAYWLVVFLLTQVLPWLVLRFKQG